MGKRNEKDWEGDSVQWRGFVCALRNEEKKQKMGVDDQTHVATTKAKGLCGFINKWQQRRRKGWWCGC